jgi:Secretion system C-terminal sorting domain
MKKITILITICFVIGYVLPSLGQGNFNTSLHKTRNGKPTWYDSEKGGFETLTSVPIEELGCVECHDANDANGDPYPATGYSPDCVDCHATNSTWAVTQNDCLGCHSREAAIINKGIPDVHRDASTPFVCKDCHKKEELHGDDGVEYSSMFDTGAIETDCQQSGCHESVASNSAHNQHLSNIHCTSCHASTNLTCYNCHFESQVEDHLKRAYSQLTDFIILVNRTKDGKVHPATFQSLSYQGNTWIAMGPSVAHSITKDNARTCSDCHANFGGNIPAIDDYNNGGGMKFATWNESDSTLSYLHGVVPLPIDYRYSFKMDFITYNGDPGDPVAPSNNWSYVKDEADGFQLLYATPLTKYQMAKLGMDTLAVSVEKQINSIPDGYKLEQNYPNPFNPSTTIRYSIPESGDVEIVIYDALGKEIQTLITGYHDTGVYEVNFDATGLTSGIYFYQINAVSFVETRKLVLMK